MVADSCCFVVAVSFRLLAVVDSVSSSWPQLSSGLSRRPLPASLRHQAQRLQGLPRPEHREGEVAAVFKIQKGKDPKASAGKTAFRLCCTFHSSLTT